jgi:hypothetical protein
MKCSHCADYDRARQHPNDIGRAEPGRNDGGQVSSNGPLTQRISPARGNRRYSISESQMQFGNGGRQPAVEAREPILGMSGPDADIVKLALMTHQSRSTSGLEACAGPPAG